MAALISDLFLLSFLLVVLACLFWLVFWACLFYLFFLCVLVVLKFFHCVFDIKVWNVYIEVFVGALADSLHGCCVFVCPVTGHGGGKADMTNRR